MRLMDWKGAICPASTFTNVQRYGVTLSNDIYDLDR